MGCCGRTNAVGNATFNTSATARSAAFVHERRGRSFVVFEYFGATAMSVRGGSSGKLYRFVSPGARQAVEARDVPSVRGVPRLREVL